MRLKSYFSLVVLVSLAAACSQQEQPSSGLSVNSPDQKLRVEFYVTAAGEPGYVTEYDNKIIIDSSKLGFILDSIPSLNSGFEIASSSRITVDTTWEQPWGEQRLIRNNYNELTISIREKHDGRSMNIIFRLFDYGLGFRYEFPMQKGLESFKILDELTEFNIHDSADAWWIPAYKGNRYEFIPKKDPISDLKFVHTPLTIETSTGTFISIHEASLVDFASMVIEGKGNNKLKCDLVPWKNGVRTYVTESNRVTPWRTIQVADKPGDLVTSYLILNLNEPNKIGDVSWIKPGKYVGVWWEMHLNTGTWYQGPKHAANTTNTKRYIDFAAKHGFDGVLVEGWNFGWDGNWMNGGTKFNFTKPYPDYDIEYLSKYGKEKGVYIVGHHETGADVENYESQLEDAYQFLEEHNMKAVKTGYVGDSLVNGEWHHGQYSVRHHQRVVEMAAKHHVMVVAHEPIKDTGLRRTYPNFVSREAARGQEYNAWAGDGGNPPDYVTIIPFTRMLSGPMDYTPGVFDIKLPTQPNNQINGTLAKELALYVILYAPLQMACDLPENYEGNPAFKFIDAVATDWETTKVLEASIGNYVSIARQQRGSDDWFVGTITNENPRSVSLNLDFLDSSRKYKATLYKDASDADYKTNPTAVTIEEIEVNSTSVLNFQLAGSGGAAISIIESK